MKTQALSTESCRIMVAAAVRQLKLPLKQAAPA